MCTSRSPAVPDKNKLPWQDHSKELGCPPVRLAGHAGPWWPAGAAGRCWWSLLLGRRTHPAGAWGGLVPARAREDGQDRAHSAPSHLMRLMNRGHSSLLPVISQPGQNCCSCCSQDDHQHGKHSRVRPFGAIFCIYLKICSLGSHVNPRLQIT